MAFVDDITLTVCSGNGGDGVVRWTSIRGKALGGPSGGNGGKGGDVYIRGVGDVGVLRSYRHVKAKRAEHGGDGMSESMHGKDGADLVLDVPVGSVVSVFNVMTASEFEVTDTNKEVVAEYEVLEEGEIKKVLSGGRGGLGNEHFKTSTNRSPRQSTKGAPGLCATLYIELRLIADIGLVGTPNSGKTTLLNSLTRADAKVGNYAFTTLTPNLGVVYGKVIADIPGLIEGASHGKGLGYTFLRHITRVNSLIFCISVERDDPVDEFKMLKKELCAFDQDLPKKPTLVIFTKIDMLAHEQKLKEAETMFAKEGVRTMRVSALTGDGMETLKAFVSKS